MDRWLASLACAAALLGNSHARAADYFVAPNGDDTTGDGTEAKPWRTIAHAVNTGIPPAGGDTVVVKDGEYHGTNTLTRGFGVDVTVRAEHPYKARLTNTDGTMEVLRVYLEGSARLIFDGFIFTNEHPTYTCPNGREDYYLIHLQDVSDVVFRNNIVHGNNAPGRCNELLKINRGSDTAYPRNLRIEGNVFYDRPNAGGTDLIDSVRPGELDVVDNIFFDSADKTSAQSFLTLKREVATQSASSPRHRIHRNVFLSWGGASDQAFLQLGEDGQAETMMSDVLIENNLLLGNSIAPMAAPFQLKGCSNIHVRANTVVGSFKGGSFGFRIGTEEQNLPSSGFALHNNVFSDPSGHMLDRLVNTYGLVDVASISLDNNLYWNAGGSLPATGSVLPVQDAHGVLGDPRLDADQAGIVLPRFDESTGKFLSGSSTIRQEFLRLVETYGAPGSTSAAIDSANSTDMPADDIRGLARGASADLGAYELEAANPAPDAGTGPDAGATHDASGAFDASGAPEAGASPPAAAAEEGGCGCRVGPAPGRSAATLLFGIAALSLVRRRRGLALSGSRHRAAAHREGFAAAERYLA